MSDPIDPNDFARRYQAILDRRDKDVIAESSNSEKLHEIWEQHIRLSPSRHPMSGWSVKNGKLIAILGKDGVWHEITPSPAAQESDPRRC